MVVGRFWGGRESYVAPLLGVDVVRIAYGKKRESVAAFDQHVCVALFVLAKTLY